jgi:hypothetical protein
VRIVADVSRLMGQLPDAMLVVDGTGVGRGIVDMFEGQVRFEPVSIHGGAETTYSDGYHRVPKREVVATVQRVLQEQRLKIGRDLPEVDVLIHELQTFKAGSALAGTTAMVPVVQTTGARGPR